MGEGFYHIVCSVQKRKETRFFFRGGVTFIHGLGKGLSYRLQRAASCFRERFLSYRLQRATKEENQPNAVEGALAPPNVAVRVQ